VLVPLYGFLQGDTMGLVILVQDSDKMSAVAACLQEAACMRVRPRPCARVYRGGASLDPDLTVSEAGLTALDRVDVVQEPGQEHELEEEDN
jgi:hypothetical protein